MAVTTISATDTTCRTTIVGLHAQVATGANGNSTNALPAYSTPISWRAGARAVSSLLINACAVLARAASKPNRTAVTRPPTGARPRTRGIVCTTGLQTVPVSSSIRGCTTGGFGGRDHDRVHGTAGSPGPDGSVGRPEDLDLPQDHRRARWRPLGRSGDPRPLLRGRGQRLLHPLSPVDRRPQRVPARQGRRGRRDQGAQRPGGGVATLPDGRPWHPRKQWDRFLSESSSSPRRPTARTPTRPAGGWTR